ncbi:hypothetical protein RRV45_06295 [Bacillus sp. DTU_2020_1000418_1_SI_GHA_SEK_038]|uniref:hypothetical protein n=1 Tax=Bacillus sp. DTU_2020_1000418_1_SI_GHA_SEK_038 TaxID=3077585 RepID=UPI0028E514B4|nr:hypothetical protein [Bacillus sp. DTU_2020_1000418_1_SI_GHA_SEK_038]WNS76613.1 hypothetical protein RRV45_06295 [Bacillus sp. DTU_2020_1000418_1_SI_GHA_SEK_038]
MTRKDQREIDLLEALDKAVEAVQQEYAHPIVIKNFFPYICDMSCVAKSDNEQEIQTVIENNPG